MLFITGMCYQCANIVAPKGGPEDETPPILDTLNSTPNMMTNYAKTPITLAFNEWLELKDVSEQIVISPPLEQQLDVKLRKKNVVVNFHEDEVLKENTTYTINFGDAVRDLTEGNVPPGLRYVFSTGDVIDSLSVSAKLIDLNTKEPIEGALLMLYDNLADSVFYKARPYYFAKSDTGGVARIENIRLDTFKVVALLDGNLNYQLDETEQNAFLLQPILLNPANQDTTLGTLELYVEALPLQNLSERFAYGKVAIKFNRTPYDLNYEVIGSPPELYREGVVGDSLLFWYQDTSQTTWSVILNSDTTYIDTVKVEYSEQSRPKLIGQFNAEQSRKAMEFSPDTTLTFRWNQPLSTIDQSKFVLWKDSATNIVPVTYQIHPDRPNFIFATANWEFPAQYNWTIDAGAVTDLWSTQSDSIGTIAVKAMDTKDFGEIAVHLTGLKAEQDYIVKLVKGESTIAERRLFKDDITVSPADSLGISTITADQTFSYLRPNTLTLQVIEDNNSNGRWDTGNYKLGTPPERIYIKVLQPLKANWELKIDFNL